MDRMDHIEVRMTRRQVLAMGGTAGLAAALTTLLPAEALAGRKEAKQLLEQLTGGTKPELSRIAIDLPPYTEYGKQVRVAIAVDSPMTADDRVKAIHIIAERNTVPEIATYRFGPMSGMAKISTRIRVARTQILTVLAEMGDGSFHIGKARCKIARGGGGCG
ncbi:thiosulfate oxidation carrier protein SoxY [Magnetospira sp. QH-2]|uniref:thiosulfate oxidation carrier protein SoxY n=1 Tax=Magnetospira sp. (strain QH-2) TaxID=1288970 RepID=UPI0003E811EE|nr:thiosulfate oxidation carrier protein SoxY [Magnetospira sp. QH-2]CCQ74018.1 Putative thiosulfate-binding protein SoxY [Magnetospira sp. QH-2]